MFYIGSHAGRKGRGALAACALACLAAVASCTSNGGQPSWAGSLGSGVTVESPGSTVAGNVSLEGVLIGVATAFSTGHYSDMCRYAEPSQRSGCTSAWSGSPGLDVDLADFPTFKNLKPGYIAIDGDKALIGFTGTVCVLKLSPSCFTNKDPAAILDSGKSFSALWMQSLMWYGDGYYPSPAVNINGNWYAYTVNSTIVNF
jgi:hypothetical protein